MRNLTLEEFAAELDAVPGVLAGPHDKLLAEQLKPMARQGIGDNFEGSQSPDGDYWPERKHIGDGHPLLMDTLALVQAATGEGQGSIELVDAESLLLAVDGNEIPYAAVHNRGGGNNIPQREYMGVSDETEEAMGEVIADDVMQKAWPE